MSTPTVIHTEATPSRPSRQLFWAHVTAFGALWGTMEITVGSFLHTLRFPFSGILLAALSATVIVAQRQILPSRGLTLATGIVAALCKSLSPGGVILGPMIGISFEALLAELTLLLAPRALPSALVAGALCALWAAFQGLLTQLVFYGARIFDLYLAAVRKAGDLLGLSATTGWTALAAMVGVVALIGAFGGLVGWRLGRDAAARLGQEGADER